MPVIPAYICEIAIESRREFFGLRMQRETRFISLLPDGEREREGGGEREKQRERKNGRGNGREERREKERNKE